MSFDRKLIRNGNGWALAINATILEFLGVNPEENMVQYEIENNILKITKSSKKIPEKSKTTKNKQK